MTLLDRLTMSIAPPVASNDIGHVDPGLYRQAMRNHALAVTIISTGTGDERTGLTATSVCSLSDSPPSIIACVNRNASAYELLRKVGVFGVNLLGSDQTELASLFAGRRGVEREQRFADNQWTSLVTGAPILKDALASLDCELMTEHQYGTHSIFVGLVRDVRVRDDLDPLLYFGGVFHALPVGTN